MSATAGRETFRNFLKRALRCYRACAIIVFNTFMLFVLVNLILFLVIKIKDGYKQENPMYEKHGESLVAEAYPEYTKEDRDRLLQELWARRAWIEFDPFTHYKERAFVGQWVNVHANGFRLTKDQGPWPLEPTNLNIFLFGGSTTFGVGVADDQTIASHLQKFLQDHSRSVKVYNFGRSGYYSTQERILFEKLLVANHIPAIAIFIDGINDCQLPDDTTMFADQLGQVFEKRPSGFETFLAELPAARAAKFIVGHPAKPSQDQRNLSEDEGSYKDDSAHVVNRYSSNKRLIEAASHTFGVRPVSVWQPAPGYKYDLSCHLFAKDMDSETRANACRQKYGYLAMAALAKETPKDFSNGFLWLGDIQEQLKEPLYVDYYHYNSGFSKEIASRIGHFLLKEHLLDAQAP